MYPVMLQASLAPKRSTSITEFGWPDRFVAFVLDTIEFGEIPGIHHGVHDLAMWHWLSLGYTPAAVEVWNRNSRSGLSGDAH